MLFVTEFVIVYSNLKLLETEKIKLKLHICKWKTIVKKAIVYQAMNNFNRLFDWQVLLSLHISGLCVVCLCIFCYISLLAHLFCLEVSFSLFIQIPFSVEIVRRWLKITLHIVMQKIIDEYCTLSSYTYWNGMLNWLICQLCLIPNNANNVRFIKSFKVILVWIVIF